jgi:hypothetical protein
MLVAINLMARSGDDETARMMESLCLQLAAMRPDDRFLFFSGESGKGNTDTSNITRIVIGPATFSRSTRWYEFRLKQMLHRLNPDCVLHTDGIPLSGCRIRQYAVLPFANAPMLHALNPSYRNSMQKRLPFLLKKAGGIIGFWPETKAYLESTVKAPISNFHNLPWPGYSLSGNKSFFDKEQTRQTYTDGKEYFVYSCGTGEQHNLINLLKAFTLFKTRQKSNMLLVLLLDKPDEALKRKLDNYHFKDELRIIAGADATTRQSVIHAAYAWISAATATYCLQEIVLALQLRVPVLFSELPGVTEQFPGAVDTFRADVPADIAQKMMRIFKDEAFRNSLIEAGTRLAVPMDPARTTQELWQILDAARV